MPPDNPSHLLLIDASGFAYRAFHTHPLTSRHSDGLPTGAILGFMALIWDLLSRASADQPTHAAAVFDFPGKTFRHKLFPDYKANRVASKSEELAAQLPYLRHAADALGLKPVEAAGFEADDVIATLAAKAAKAGFRTTIVSSDKDMCQLVVDGSVEIVDPVSRQRLRSKEVVEKLGVEPKVVPDLQALIGDAVDNIPGIIGIGAKTGGALIRRHGKLSAVLAEARKGYRGTVPPKIREAFRRAEPSKILLYRKLALLRSDVTLPVELADLELKPVMRSHLLEILKVLEAEQKFGVMFGAERQLMRVVPALPKGTDPLAWWSAELKRPGQPVPETPQCGFYRRKLVKGAVPVPARIWREPEIDFLTEEPTGNDVIRCEVDGTPRDPAAEWTRLAMKPITEANFHFRIAKGKWATQYAPDEPEASPTKPVDWLKVPL